MDLRKTTERSRVMRHTHRRGPHVSLERRFHPRKPAVDYRVWMGGWRQGAFETVAARIENISRGGARVVSPIPFAEGKDVWLRLASPVFAGCVRAEVLQVFEDAEGAYVARVQFREGCPEPFFDIVAGPPPG